MSDEKTVLVGGVPIKVSDEPITEETVVVCVLKAEARNNPFTDNEEAPCVSCQRMVIYRPYMAPAQKMCMECAMTMMRSQRH